ncbi:hypothetical protein X925_04025 [Petrotoga sp. 9T1HF07.CasAA.8.2]|uniref:hypothetical protein n=1 Tax=Petrotoga sp. 9T1HF07.CasAA.8.2 TaxID=1434329 RepID=UPI000CBB31D6|nr:hypothetical protein [Petrotoga sp. 9T1HF07.CasAA.8.2]PNR89135.1 hypothetical protein X925_04025 [Petrotoga sp. 9T1HF07.CasAA.8.2]
MNIKLLDKIVSKGQFIRPILNYVVHYLESDRSDKNKNIINYINVLKLKWDVKYDEALEIIDEEIKGLKKGGLYYLLTKKDTKKQLV